jgi:predicted transcriptional regulator
MKADDLARIGTALYGRQWQSDLARDLGVNPRTVRHWLKGEYRIHPEVDEQMVNLLTDRLGEITGLIARLK